MHKYAPYCNRNSLKKTGFNYICVQMGTIIKRIKNYFLQPNRLQLQENTSKVIAAFVDLEKSKVIKVDVYNYKVYISPDIWFFLVKESEKLRWAENMMLYFVYKSNLKGIEKDSTIEVISIIDSASKDVLAEYKESEGFIYLLKA